MLRTAFGSAIARFLEDPTIVEVMLNPDGRLWIDRLSDGLADTDELVSAPDGERIVRLVAHHVGAEVHAGSPRVSAELPETGERFEGLLPPVVAAPAFAIRKPAVAVFTLDDYVATGIMTSGQADALKGAVETCEEHSCGRRHLQRQDDADQRIAGRSRQDFGSGRSDRRHARASVQGTESGGAAHQGRRDLAIGSGPIIAAPTARSYSDRRGARRGGPRSAQGLGHGSSGRHRYHPCGHRARSLTPA